MTPLLVVEALDVSIGSGEARIDAVRNLSFAIAPGETVGLVGESGSGKSMTTLAITGLMPAGTRFSISGRALFEGRDLLELSESELRSVRGRGIGMVFQSPAQALNPLMPIGAQIGEAVRAAGGDPGRVAALIDEVELAGVQRVERRYPHELSGGQQQRAMIAIALAGDPKLLIADEPTTALDVSVEARILELLRRLRSRRGMALLLVSHDLGLVRAMADQVVVLRKGAVLESGPAATTLAAPKEAYTRALIACRPRLDAPQERLPTLAEPHPTAPPRPAPDKSLLMEAKGLRVSYPGRGFLAPSVGVLHGVDIALPKGGALGIVGESGSGKSTLAKAIVGLAPRDAGVIVFDGATLDDPRRMPPRHRRRIQYVFQDPYGALNPRMTVERLLVEPMAIHGIEATRSRLLALLDEVGLSELHLKRYPRELSGGQRQRVTIARALALEPDLLICDEIVSALDVSIQAQVLNLLKDIQAARRLALLFISHDIAVVQHMCETIAVMQNGAIVETGPSAAVIRAPQAPYTQSLLSAVRRDH